MKIAHVIDAQLPVRGYGGTERVVYNLGRAQAERGDEVTFVCRSGSRVDFARTVDSAGGVAGLPDAIDIVHFHGPPAREPARPYLLTVHGNGKPGEVFLPNTVFVSRDHAARHDWTEFAYNGIDLNDYPAGTAARGDRLLFLAKAKWPVKNLDGALRIARAAGLPLDIAGGRAPWAWRLRAMLGARFGARVGGAAFRSWGMIDGEAKLALLRHARALLFPVLWPEPFGMAVIEALACGAPVLATPRGSLPEIVTPECGVLSDSFAALVDAARSAHRFDPAACRARVAENFTHRHMAEAYAAHYARVLRDGRLREGRPRTLPEGAELRAPQGA